MSTVDRDLFFENIRKFMKSEGYIVKSDHYKNNRQKLFLVCSAGHQCCINWNKFKEGIRCKICSCKKRADGRRKDFGYIKAHIKSEGYIIKSACYVNSNRKLDLICSSGHFCSISWDNFRSGVRCKICSLKKCVKNRKLNFGYIKGQIESEKYTVKSEYYISIHQKLLLVCPQGHKCYMSWNQFRSGYRCKKCGIEDKKLKFEDIKKYIESEGFKLESKHYVNSNQKLCLVCPQGHRYRACWNGFQQGHRCPKCIEWKNEKKLGEILEKMFPNQIRSQDNLGFLGRQRVDYSVRSLNLAFEYDGIQHFKPVTYGRINRKTAQQQLEECQERDRRKERLCQEHEYGLVRVAYNEELNAESIKEKVKRILKR